MEPDRIHETQYSQFLSALLAGNRATCSSIVKQQLAIDNSVKNLYESIIKKALYEVGVLWERNKISVATEHMATAITEALLNECFSNVVGQARVGKKVVVACVENELHQVGIKMVADVFEMNGWDAYFLGANTPTNELINFTKTVQPDLLALSLSIYFNLPVLMEMIKQFQSEFPTLPIIVGGQAFNRGGLEALKQVTNIQYLHDLNAIEQYLKKTK